MEPSKSTRTTSSKSKLKMNPSDVDDATTRDLKGFKQAGATESDPAYNKILSKCGKVENYSRWGGALLAPKDDSAYDGPKEWSRGKSKEPK